jgi:hypothetical protein
MPGQEETKPRGSSIRYLKESLQKTKRLVPIEQNLRLVWKSSSNVNPEVDIEIAFKADLKNKIQNFDFD